MPSWSSGEGQRARFYGDRWIGSFHTVIVFTQRTGVVSPSGQAIYLEDVLPNVQSVRLDTWAWPA